MDSVLLCNKSKFSDSVIENFNSLISLKYLESSIALMVLKSKISEISGEISRCRYSLLHSKCCEQNSIQFSKYNTKKISVYISGVRLRRQHWCLLSVFLLVLVICVALGLPSITGTESPSNHEERIQMVKQLLKTVPLIDG